MNKADLVVDIKTELGECPTWDYINNCLYWVDIYGCKIYRYVPETEKIREWQTPSSVGSIALHEDGNLIVALEDGLYYLDLDLERYTLICAFKFDMNLRFNDGKCDPEGRFWVGSMAVDQQCSDAFQAGALYKLDGMFLKEMISDVTISNGLDWWQTKMYYIDTYTNEVVCYDFDEDQGSISNKSLCISFKDELGCPDGMTLDEEGMLWIAHWGGYKVSRWDPKLGKKIGEIKVPAENVTSITFGGLHLNELYITTEKQGVYKTTLDIKGRNTFLVRHYKGVKNDK